MDFFVENVFAKNDELNMCGIAGIKQFNYHELPDGILSEITNSLSHRGPDDKGLFVDSKNNLHLGHARLSIIDLSDKAHQPMESADGKYVIVYNGEIYNYENIRENLLCKGHRFLSNSDTEVILKAYQEWGDACLGRFNGMFSFCIWDRDNKKLFLARDRFGIKPLYYYFGSSDFIFASELKTILASELAAPEIDYESVGLFLSLGYIPSPKTIYKNIFSLEPGYFLEVTKQGIQKKRYYDQAAAFSSEVIEMRENEAVERVRTELIESVRCHLISDVEVGTFLSGGIDSSSLVSLMRQVGQRDIKTVSVVFPGLSFDESRYARLVSQKFETKHIEVQVNENNFFQHLETILDSMDQPTYDGINTYFVSWAAKQAGLKAILSGVGGDEIFGGYPTFKKLPQSFHLFKKIGSISSPLMKKFPFSKKDKLIALAENGKLSFLEAYLIYRGVFPKSAIEKILNSDLAKEACVSMDLDGFSQRVEKIRDDFSKISFLESVFYMSGQLLRDVDVFSMVHSLEIRVPFVNHQLIEALGRIPSRYRTGSSPKKLLIDAVGDLPKEVYRRPKQGFDLPFDSWLRSKRGMVVIDELRTSEIYNQDYIQQLLKNFGARGLHWSRIWSLFVLNRFLRKHVLHRVF